MQESQPNRPRTALRALLLTSVGAVIVFGVLTLVALEGQEVVRLHSSSATGDRVTRVWLARDGAGRIWLEANNPRSPWLVDVLASGRIELEIGGERAAYRALPDPNPAAHTRVRALMRSKYGWADQWVGMLFGHPHSIAVRVLPERPPSGS